MNLLVPPTTLLSLKGDAGSSMYMFELKKKEEKMLKLKAAF